MYTLELSFATGHKWVSNIKLKFLHSVQLAGFQVSGLFVIFFTIKSLIHSFPQDSGDKLVTHSFLAKSSSFSHSLFFSKKSSIILSARNL